MRAIQTLPPHPGTWRLLSTSLRDYGVTESVLCSLKKEGNSNQRVRKAKLKVECLGESSAIFEIALGYGAGEVVYISTTGPP